MAPLSLRSESVSDLADRIEAVREELLSIQRSLEKMEPKTPDAPQSEAFEE
jgi:hypothetical protein